MHSHRRPRGRIFFEVLCALTVGASFVGAWIQTGAWAFIGPAFVFTVFGLYWSFDMFGARAPAIAVRPAAESAPLRAIDSEPVADLESAVMPEIRFERFEAPAEPAIKREIAPLAEPEAEMAVVPFASEPEPVVQPQPKAKARKPRASKKAAEPAVDPAQVADEEPHFDHHIEPLFEPQPFARQARPAFGKRSRGPGPSPLPAA